MNPFNLEKKLRRLKKSVPVHIPDIVRLRQDQAYQAIRRIEQATSVQKHASAIKRHRMIRQSAAALSAIVIIGTAAGGLMSPAMADALKNLPVVGGVFKLAGDQGLQNAEERGIVSPVNVSDTHDGVTLSIPAVAFDESRLSFALERSGTGYSAPLNGSIDSGTAGPAQEKASISDIDLLINGQSMFSKEQWGKGPYIMSKPTQDPDKIIFTLVDGANQGDTQLALPDMMNLTALITLKGIDAPFRLTVPIQKNGEKPHVIEPKLVKQARGIQLSLEKVEFTTLSTRLHLMTKGISTNANQLQYDIIDDQGNELSLLVGNARRRGNNGDDDLYTDYLVDPLNPEVRSFTIKPYFPVFADEKAQTGLFKLDANGNVVKTYVKELEMKVQVRP